MKANNTYYKVTAIKSGVSSHHTDKHIAEAELNNLLNNGKPAKMETILTTSDYWNTDNFAVVDEFPAGAIVWNIGRQNFPFPGFIPVAWPLDDCHIDRARLMAVKCKDDETADAILKEAGRRGVNAERFAELNAKQTETTVISLPKYYTETPERLRLLASSMADQYRGLNDPEAKRMMALYLDITGNPEYFLKNNLIKAI